jgi:hypothetical protein
MRHTTYIINLVFILTAPCSKAVVSLWATSEVQGVEEKICGFFVCLYFEA